MIYNLEYQDLTPLPIVAHMTRAKYGRVLDVGACYSEWSRPFATHYMDLHELDEGDGHAVLFQGHACLMSTWFPVFEEVSKNGKFDFGICSHTLEDLACYQFVVEMLNHTCNAGYVAVPSKNVELTVHPDGLMGHPHHRWVFDRSGPNQVTGYPKLPMLMAMDWSAVVLNWPDDVHQMAFLWKDGFDIPVANGDFMGPTMADMPAIFAPLAENNYP